jgi:hypothetical protein
MVFLSEAPANVEAVDGHEIKASSTKRLAHGVKVCESMPIGLFRDIKAKM